MKLGMSHNLQGPDGNAVFILGKFMNDARNLMTETEIRAVCNKVTKMKYPGLVKYIRKQYSILNKRAGRR